MRRERAWAAATTARHFYPDVPFAGSYLGTERNPDDEAPFDELSSLSRSDARAGIGGRFAVLENLTTRASFETYRTHDLVDGGLALLSLLSPLSLSRPAVERSFRQHVARLARISSPHVPEVVAEGEHNGQFFFATRFVEGTSLDRLARVESLATARAVSLVVQLARAVEAAHYEGLAGLWLRPHGALVEDAGTPREGLVLVDLGLAHALRAAVDDRVPLVGRPDYLAPELIRSGDLSGAADVYAVGCIAFELLAGRLPFRGETPWETLRCHALESAPPSLASIRPGLPPALDAIFAETLANDPFVRPSIAELRLSFEALLRDLG